MGWNSAETLLPVNLHSNEGGRGSRDGSLLFAQNYNFLFLKLNSPSIVVVLGKVALGRRKISYTFYVPSPKENGDFELQPF